MQGAILERYEYRLQRTRRKIRERQTGRARLSVCRTLKHIYVQLIDDANGKTLAAASSLTPELKLKNGGNISSATAVGKLIAEKAMAKGIKQVVFDRGGHIY